MTGAANRGRILLGSAMLFAAVLFMAAVAVPVPGRELQRSARRRDQHRQRQPGHRDCERRSVDRVR